MEGLPLLQSLFGFILPLLSLAGFLYTLSLSDFLYMLQNIAKNAYDDSEGFLGSNKTTQFGPTSKLRLSKTLPTEFRMESEEICESRLLEALWLKLKHLVWDLGVSFRPEITFKPQSLAILLAQLRMGSQVVYEPPSIESLPYELRMQILRCIPDFSDLVSFVQASPVLFRQYLEAKKSLLAGCLKMSLNTVLVDALAVQEAATLRGDKSVKRDDVKMHLDKYSVKRKVDESKIDALIDKYDEDFLLGIYLFWQTYARPLTGQVARFFLSRFDPQRPPMFTHLSAVESTRLLRALYRFELYSCLFGGESRFLQLGFDEEEVLYFFFCLFRPWEVEEIFSVYTLVQDEMTTRLRMMEKKLFHAVTHEFAFAGGAASWGLRGFDMALTDTNCHSMITIRPGNQPTSGYGFMENILCHEVQEKRRRLFTTDDDLAEYRGDPLPYAGEAESQPPFGWVLACKEKHINTYGGCAHKPSPRDWGYVFWDRWRLTKIKGDGKLKIAIWEPGEAF